MTSCAGSAANVHVMKSGAAYCHSVQKLNNKKENKRNITRVACTSASREASCNKFHTTEACVYSATAARDRDRFGCTCIKFTSYKQEIKMPQTNGMRRAVWTRDLERIPWKEKQPLENGG